MQAELGRLLTSCNPLLIKNYMMYIIIRCIVTANQTTFGLLLTRRVYHIDLNRIILYHIDIKIQRVNKYIPFVYSALNIMSRFVKEPQGVCEFNEKAKLINKHKNVKLKEIVLK